MIRLFSVIFLIVALCRHGHSQTNPSSALAMSLEGFYSGSYMSRKKDVEHTNSVFLKYISDNKIIIRESKFGPFELTVTDNGDDTLFFRSSLEKMKVKYIKTSRRISFISDVDGERVNFNGKYSYKDAEDLARIKAKNEESLKALKEELRYYGIFYGSINFNNDDKIIMDTVIVYDFVKTHTKENLIIDDKIARFISKSEAFDPFEIKVLSSNNGNLISAHLKDSLDLQLNYETQTLYLENRFAGYIFQGILIESKSK